MHEPNQYDVLLRVASVLNSSLPRYLHFAHPWHRRSDQEALEVLEQIVADQDRMIDRISQYVLESETPVQLAGYPMDFTGLHDLSLSYLLKELLAYQKRDIEVIAICVEQLATAPMAKALAEEALGLSKGHLELLEELAKPPAEAAA